MEECVHAYCVRAHMCACTQYACMHALYMTGEVVESRTFFGGAADAAMRVLADEQISPTIRFRVRLAQ